MASPGSQHCWFLNRCPGCLPVSSPQPVPLLKYKGSDSKMARKECPNLAIIDYEIGLSHVFSAAEYEIAR